MLWAVTGAKGGVGTSTIACHIASEMARIEPTLLVDLAGDQSEIVGIEVSRSGALDWLAAEDEVGVEALERLLVPAADDFDLLPAGDQGRRIESASRVGQLVAHLRSRDGVVIIDVGAARPHPTDWRAAILAGADRRTLVVRACYLTLHRARQLPYEFDDVVEVSEPGRALTTTDIEGVLARPVAVRVPFDPTVARAVDAGLLVRRSPRRLRGLRALTFRPQTTS